MLLVSLVTHEREFIIRILIEDPSPEKEGNLILAEIIFARGLRIHRIEF